MVPVRSDFPILLVSYFGGVFKLIQFMNEPTSLVNINRRELLFKLDFYDKSLVGLTAVVW